MVDQTKTEQRVPSYVHQGHAAKQGSYKSQCGQNYLEIALNFFQFHIDIWRSLIMSPLSMFSIIQPLFLQLCAY